MPNINDTNDEMLSGCDTATMTVEEEEDDAANIPAPWTDVDEARLVALRNAPIEMAHTLYGRFLATQKRDAERAYQHMDAKEREAFLRKLSEIDADDAENGRSTPTNPTPNLIVSKYSFMLHIATILRALLLFSRCQSRPNAVVSNVSNSLRPEMSPMLVSEGKSAKTVSYTASRQYDEGAGAGARSSNDRKQLNDAAIQRGSKIVPYCSVF